MDDFLFYFLAGMFGEELVRLMATKKVYFPLLWFVCSASIALVFMLVTLLFFFMDLYQGRAPDKAFTGHVKDFMSFHFVLIQPLASLFYAGMGFFLAVSYRWHYRNSQKQQA